MHESHAPRPYTMWRSVPIERAEDAASAFGQDLIRHCRTEALKSMKNAPMPTTHAELEALVATAVDTALHNTMALLEGFWVMPSGDGHQLAYVLGVRVADKSGKQIESIDISPSMLDLPIGYWKWANKESR